MKTPLLSLLVVAIASGQVASINPLSPEATRLQIHSGEESPFLRVSDPGNHRWMLQSSTDLTHWTTDGPSYRVFNGELTLPLPAPEAATPRKYFRLNPDLAAAVPSSAARALRLPAQPYNYANQDLPAVFVDDILL
jgi:cytochrome c peroxidase